MKTKPKRFRKVVELRDDIGFSPIVKIMLTICYCWAFISIFTISIWANEYPTGWQIAYILIPFAVLVIITFIIDYFTGRKVSYVEVEDEN